jgi:hypothetical protein
VILDVVARVADWGDGVYTENGRVFPASAVSARSRGPGSSPDTCTSTLTPCP